MKILIVDDEMLVRIGIKSCIECEKHGIEVVGEAENGLEAVEKIHTLQPDVVLLDIKMPVMDGLEVMKTIKEEKLPCAVVILSSFDDFQHVKEAMKLGAVDYLHKPQMSSKDILSVLTSINETVQQKEKEAYSMGKDSKAKLKNIFLQELLGDEYKREENFLEICKQHEIEFTESNFCCITFSVKDYNQTLNRYKKNGQDVLHNSIVGILDKILSNEKCVEFVSHEKNIYALIYNARNNSSKQRVLEEINAIIHLVTDAMKTFLNIQIVIGVCEIYPSYLDIGRAYTQAKATLGQKFYESNDIIYFHEIKTASVNKDSDSIDLLIKKCKTYIHELRCDELKVVVEEFADLARKNRIEEQEVKNLFNGLLFLMEESPAFFEVIDLINDCETIDEVCRTYKKYIDNKLAVYSLPKCSPLTRKAIEYVHKHFKDEITLKELSKDLNVTPNYISRLFKVERGQGLFDYINEYRIHKAKDMLNDSNDKIYEIAEKVGFNSAVHFNIVFNKFTGLSPKEYRNQYFADKKV